jgi:hypothetical protein
VNILALLHEIRQTGLDSIAYVPLHQGGVCSSSVIAYIVRMCSTGWTVFAMLNVGTEHHNPINEPTHGCGFFEIEMDIN